MVCEPTAMAVPAAAAARDRARFASRPRGVPPVMALTTTGVGRRRPATEVAKSIEARSNSGKQLGMRRMSPKWVAGKVW